MPGDREALQARPRILIGSASESVGLAYRIQKNLDYEHDCVVWTQGIFEPGRPTWTCLAENADKLDFAVFLFGPVDTQLSRGVQQRSPRDNLVFELGFFAGKIGIDRCAVLKPRHSDSKAPSDLAGFSPITYNDRRGDGNTSAALGAACQDIRELIQRTGPVDRGVVPAKLDEEWARNHKRRLVFRPELGRDKMMRFGPNKEILDGNNTNESRWSIIEDGDKLQFLRADGTLHNEFCRSSNGRRLESTNSEKAFALRVHNIRDQYLEPSQMVGE